MSPSTRRRTTASSSRRRPTAVRWWLAAGAAAVAFAVAIPVALGGLHKPVEADGVAAELVYTPATANDTAVVVPAALRATLREIGHAHRKVALTRVESTGRVSTQVVDLTPRVGAAPDSPVLKVRERADRAIEAKITAIERLMAADPAATGNRGLFVGLLKHAFLPGVPVFIITSGLDLVRPLDFRVLGFDVPPSQILQKLRASGELPDLGGAEVTFVLAPVTGAQEQLRRPQRDYLADVWRTLLLAGGAVSVDFLDAAGTPSADAPSAPVVPVPEPPGTPVRPKPAQGRPGTVICELSAATYFVPDTARLLDRTATIGDLRTCVTRAGKDTEVTLDGWTAYYGPLDSAGRPTHNPRLNVDLSRARVRTVADLLVSMGIERRRIVRLTGHGVDGQPHRDPGSAQNRVVVITFTAK